MKIIQDPRTMIFYVPSNTPEFSSIENMFSLLKKLLKSMRFTTKEQVSLTATQKMFTLEKSYFDGFFRRSFQEMQKFWLNLDRRNLLQVL